MAQAKLEFVDTESPGEDDGVWRYFSKWRQEWVDFKKPPTDGELFKLKQANYKLRRGNKDLIY